MGPEPYGAPGSKELMGQSALANRFDTACGFAGRLAHARYAIPVLLAAGLAIRSLAVAKRGIESQIPSEMYDVALVFARRGEIADAFVPGSGLTAHVSPLPPVIAGMVYRFTGNGGLLSEVCLTLWSLAVIFTGFLLLYRAFSASGMGRTWGMAALALLLLVPPHWFHEAVSFRTWEGGLATLFFAAGLFILARCEQHGGFPRALLIGMAAIIGLAFLSSPIVGLALIGCSAVFYLRRRSLPKAAGVAVLLGCAALAAITPWALRNEAALGHPVLLRSNFGLVLASAYHDGAYEARTGAQRMVEFPAYLEKINPYSSKAITRDMMRRGGEVAYNQQLKEQAVEWIANNPSKAMALAVRYAGDFLFTPPYTWAFFRKTDTPAMYVQAYISAAMTSAGLLGLLICLIWKERLAIYGLIYIGSATALYALSQPTPRYHYIIHPLLVFLALRGAELWWKRRKEKAMRTNGAG